MVVRMGDFILHDGTPKFGDGLGEHLFLPILLQVIMIEVRNDRSHRLE